MIRGATIKLLVAMIAILAPARTFAANTDELMGLGLPAELARRIGPSLMNQAGTAYLPPTDNTVDLGSDAFSFNEGFFQGTVYVDDLQINGSDLIGATTANVMRTDSSDTNDNKQWTVGGGGLAGDVTRGGSIYVAGNEHANTGRVILQSGQHATGSVDIYTGTGSTARRWLFEGTGQLQQDGTNGAELRVERAQAPVTMAAANTLTAAGTTISDALQLTAVVNNVTAAAAGTGVKLWDTLNTLSGYFVYIRNGGANAVSVYPPNGSGTINGGGAGVGVSVAAGSHAIFYKVAANTWIGLESPAA